METMGTAQDLENIGVKSTHLCWCHVDALQLCLISVSLLFWPIAPSQRIINARARDTCPRNCRSRRRSTARVRHARIRGLPTNSDCTSQISWTMCIFGFIFHNVSSEASLDKALWRLQNCRKHLAHAALSNGSTDMVMYKSSS